MSNKNKNKLIFILVLVIGAAIAWMWYISAVPSTSLAHPSVSAQIEQNGEYRRLDIAEGGSYKKSQVSGAIHEASFRILAPFNSISAQQESTVSVDKAGNMVRFSVEYDQTLSGVQVLRWPVSLYGCGQALDVAERVSYTKEWDKCQFMCEKGYLYSIYITWDKFFVEYVFRTQ